MKTYISPKVQTIYMEMEEVIAASTFLVDSSKSGNQQLSNRQNGWNSIWSDGEENSNDSFW